MKKVRGLDFGADVTLPIEGGNSDGRFGIKEGYDVTHCSIYVSLLREKKKKYILSEALGWGFLCVSDHGQRLLRAAGRYGEGLWDHSFSKSLLSTSVPGQAVGWRSGLPHAAV